MKYTLLDKGSKDSQLSTKLASCLEGFKIDVVYLSTRDRVTLPRIMQTRARQPRFLCDRHFSMSPGMLEFTHHIFLSLQIVNEVHTQAQGFLLQLLAGCELVLAT